MSIAYWCVVPSPQRNSTSGRAALNGVAGSVQLGATPVPRQMPASHVMKAGQSQSSSQVQAPEPAASAAHVLAKYPALPQAMGSPGLPLDEQTRIVSSVPQVRVSG